MTWKLSPILAPLVAEVRAANPGMVVGTIGDPAHQAEVSDHNPDAWGFVCAADFMIGSSFTAADAEALFDRLRALRDGRTAYVIYNRRIFSRTVSAWTVRSYTGDPHTNHVHVSVVHGSSPHPTTTFNIYTEDLPMNQADFNKLMNGWAVSPAGVAYADSVRDMVLTTKLGKSDVTVGQSLQGTEIETRGLAAKVETIVQNTLPVPEMPNQG